MRTEGQQHCCCMDDCFFAMRTFFAMRMLFAMRTFFAMRMEGETCEWVCLLCKDIK